MLMLDLREKKIKKKYIYIYMFFIFLTWNLQVPLFAG